MLLRKGSLRTDFRRKSRLTKWNHRGNLSQECYFCLKRGFWHGHWKSKKLWRMSTQIFSSVLLVFYVILFLWEKENTGEKGKNELKSERVMALKSLRKFLLIWWFTVRSFRLLSSEYFVCETGKLLWRWSHSYLPGEVLPVILGGGAPPSSPNLDPTFRQKKAIVYTRFQPVPKIHTLSRPGLQEIIANHVIIT